METFDAYLEKRNPEFLKQKKYYERIFRENKEYNNEKLEWEDINIDKINNDSDRKLFESVVRPVIEYLCENHHPHVSIIITPTTAELMEGKLSVGHIYDYVKD